MTLHDQILHAMRRLASTGEESVSPLRVCDLISPRPRLHEVEDALEDLNDAKAVNHGRIGKGRYCLAPAEYVPDAVQTSLEVGG